MPDYEKLREAAIAGAWYCEKCGFYRTDPHKVIKDGSHPGCNYLAVGICSVDPVTILALLDERERLMATVARIEELAMRLHRSATSKREYNCHQASDEIEQYANAVDAALRSPESPEAGKG